jgi:glutathione S-transferase
MKIFYAAASPFVRKCLVVAHELGLRERVELVPASAHPIDRSAAIVAHNPLGKIPTLITGDGTVLYDSRVICEYLNALGNGQIIPAEAPARWQALVGQSLGDGIMDAAVLVRYEQAVRPESLRWPEWITGQLEKVRSGLSQIERQAALFGERVDIGTIAIGCTLGYLDLRFAALAWREHYPATSSWFARFETRASMSATRP